MIAVVIPSRISNNLFPCVDAIQKHEATARILVVDDGLAAVPSGVEVVEGKRPFIFSRAINMGIVAAMDRWPDIAGIIACNDDAMLESPGGFSLLAKAAAANLEYGIIGAVTNVTGQPLQRPQQIGLRSVPHIAFVCVYIPWRTMEKVGLLDERFANYGCDDRDYCIAVNRAGLKIGVHDGCYIDHGSLRSTYRGDPRAPKDFSENYRLLVQKWGRVD